VVLKDKPISDPKVADVLTGLMQLKEICVDFEQRKLKIEQLENDLDALKNRILNTKIHQVSSDTINQSINHWQYTCTSSTTFSTEHILGVAPGNICICDCRYSNFHFARF
jgi:hypothetical protein